MKVRVSFVDGTSVTTVVQSDVLMCDFIRQVRREAGTAARIMLVEFL